MPVSPQKVFIQGSADCHVCGKKLGWQYEGDIGGAVYGPADIKVVAVNSNPESVTFEVELRCERCKRVNRFTHVELRKP